jgi:hypothetical protein
MPLGYREGRSRVAREQGTWKASRQEASAARVLISVSDASSLGSWISVWTCVLLEGISFLRNEDRDNPGTLVYTLELVQNSHQPAGRVQVVLH